MSSRSARYLIWGAMVLSAAIAPQRLAASGSDYSRRTKDLVVTADSRWAGGLYGGYSPIRIRVRNTGKPQDLLFRFSPEDYSSLSRVEQRVTVGQNETRQFTLAVPLAGDFDYGSFAGGRLMVFRDGREIEDLTDSISVSPAMGDGVHCPSLLVVSGTKVDCEPFNRAVNSIAVAKGLMTMYGVSESEDFEVIEPVMLPESAVDYSGLDILAVPWETLKTIPEGARAAIVNWVRTGGKLLVYETGAPANDLPELRSVLGLTGAVAWRPAAFRDRKPIKVVTEEEMNNYYGYHSNESAGEEGEEEGGPILTGEYLWSDTPEAFAIQPLMLGHVIAMPGNPFPGTPHDWAWLLASLTPDTWRWATREGLTVRRPHSSFSEFSIPDVGGVPKVAFLILISGFTVVIGPLNYFLLKRRRQLYLLVVTIPCIAFLTSCALFAYAAISDGFGVTSRTRSLTILDQRNKTAVALGRTALYAGVAPSDGLRFSADTAVFPIRSEGQDASGCMVDWTNGQHFRSGWIRSRTPAHFLTSVCRTERGRLEVTPQGSSQVQVANGLAWDLDALVVVDENGAVYLGEDLPAGGSSTLELTPAADAQAALTERYKAHPLDILAGKFPSSGSVSVSSFGMSSYTPPNLNVNYVDGLLEGTIRRLLVSKGGTELNEMRREYIAILKQNPGVELGVPETEPKGDFHVIWGQY